MSVLTRLGFQYSFKLRPLPEINLQPTCHSLPGSISLHSSIKITDKSSDISGPDFLIAKGIDLPLGHTVSFEEAAKPEFSKNGISELCDSISKPSASAVDLVYRLSSPISPTKIPAVQNQENTNNLFRNKILDIYPKYLLFLSDRITYDSNLAESQYLQNIQYLQKQKYCIPNLFHLKVLYNYRKHVKIKTKFSNLAPELGFPKLDSNLFCPKHIILAVKKKYKCPKIFNSLTLVFTVNQSNKLLKVRAITIRFELMRNLM